jgi:hypothetical protein
MSALARYGLYLQKKGYFQEYVRNFLESKRKKQVK